MPLRRSAFPVALLASAGLLLAACGGGDASAAPECYLAQDGVVVGGSGIACEPPPGVDVLPTPTFTPAPQGGGAAGPVGIMIASGCATCHTIASEPRMSGTTGPVLDGVGAKGADYIRESILDPAAVIAEGFEVGLMPDNFADVLTPEQLDTLVAYLSGL